MIESINDFHVLGVLIAVLVFLVLLFFIKIGIAGFSNDDIRIKYEKAKFLYDNDRLTFRNLKRDCPDCTNVEYNKLRLELQEGKLINI